MPSLVPRFRCALQDHTSAPVIAKYDQLTRGTQQLVQAAAVIGQEVRLSVQRGGEDTRGRLTPGKCSEVSLSTNEMGARLIVLHEAFGLCFPVRLSVQGSRPILGMRTIVFMQLPLSKGFAVGTTFRTCMHLDAAHKRVQSCGLPS